MFLEFEGAPAGRAPRRAPTYQPLDGLIAALERLDALRRDLASDAARESVSNENERVKP